MVISIHEKYKPHLGSKAIALLLKGALRREGDVNHLPSLDGPLDTWSHPLRSQAHGPPLQGGRTRSTKTE